MKEVDGSGLDFSSQELLKGFEGGAVYTAKLDGKFYIIQDEGTMAYLLDEEDQAGMTFTRHLEFETLADRDEYIAERGWVVSHVAFPCR